MEDAKTILKTLKSNPEANVSEGITTYQLRATLLDPIIPESLQLLTSCYIAHKSNAVLRTVYVFCRVRGYKIILQNFPTDSHLLLLLRDGLARLDPQAWECHYSLLLWLSAVILTPFELDVFETGLFESIYESAIQFLGKSGIQRDAAAILMGRLLTRLESSQGKLTDRFVEEFNERNESTSFASIGKLQVLSQVMDRVNFVPSSVRTLVENAELLINSENDSANLWYYESALTLRLWTKILGRTAIRDLPAFAEFAVSEFIQLLDNKSSQVRMAAAKYIARIAQRIDQESSEDILGTIVESLEGDNVRYASPDYWNGALIALAELLRRLETVDETLLKRLVYNVVEFKGLHFVQPRLRNNIGANVRDAACYVCWSLFRSRGIPLTRELRETLYSSLTALACLDNEVNIRRAAAAALQEGLGRFGASSGDMPASEMFDIIEKINIYSVSLAKGCYKDLAPKFCEKRHFIKLFIVHGVNSANPDMRRLAARTAPLLKGHVEEIVDGLLDNLYIPEDDQNLHGKYLTLGVFCTLKNYEYRVEELKPLIDMNLSSSSELVCEGMLLLSILEPSKVPALFQSIVTEEPHVVKAAEELIMHLPKEMLKHELLPLCASKMGECLLFVACFVKIYQLISSREPEVIRSLLRATSLPDPHSRALAVRCLDLSREDFIQALSLSLRDYSLDERGDVGAWVREAAIEQVVTLSLKDSNDSEANTIWITDAMRAQLWKMASESRQKIRLISSNALFKLRFISKELDSSDASSFYLSLLEQCPSNMRSTVALGISSSVGAARASLATIDGSFNALIAYIRKEDWIVEEILRIPRTTSSRTLEVVRTLKRLVVADIPLCKEHTSRCLAIAYNTTLNVGIPEQVVSDAMDILQIYAMQADPRAHDRLLRILQKHPNGRIRQRAADALFELGTDDQTLETVDWTRKGFVQYAKKLSI